ncbi:hypothetical protein PC110_g13377 [Phytophthora cactorum]|uniref:SWIM-type domain-containing protein n=1 Tax=Phytophthora cactorum TaxID=29920 RepID=A0A329S0N2_9STRA|nr:hypothetical protein PC110_g13377 [Phytophthora cactorum]
MGELLRQLAACCHQRSIDVRPFALAPAPSKELLARVKELTRQQRLREHVVPRISVDFLLQDACSDVVHTLYTPSQRAYNPATNKLQEDIQVSAQVSVNTARMENEHQHATGWLVDMVTQTCSCRFYTKFAYCVHSIFAMQTRARIDGNGDEVLVNRRKRKAVGTAPTRAGRGRPPRIGRALERESKCQKVLSTQSTTFYRC